MTRYLKLPFLGQNIISHSSSSFLTVGDILQDWQVAIQKKAWNLILIPQKFVFVNYPKPKSFLSWIDCIMHFLNILNDMLPGVIKPNDVVSIEYLHYDGYLVRAMITFQDQNLAKLIHISRHLFLKERIAILRFFENRRGSHLARTVALQCEPVQGPRRLKVG
ncbi:Hypothetical predicted protein [Podarcis lilfordi]|uniref:Uncharacterized protein n=1 Tax=Podarcis lilfordi TaxID=74358 RepID=A0AA35KN77_9SAUR|nr:Hypothetical predicted protein [Podarcis lilfordi]